MPYRAGKPKIIRCMIAESDPFIVNNLSINQEKET